MNRNQRHSIHTQANPLSIMWIAMALQPVMCAIVLVALRRLELMQPTGGVLADKADYLLLVAVVCAAACAKHVAQFKRCKEALRVATRRGEQDLAPLRSRLQVAFVVGMSVAIFPSVLGVIYFVFTGTLDVALVFMVISIVLCAFFRPGFSPTH